MDTMISNNPASVPLAFVASGQASAEAMMRSSQIWASGCKMLGDIMAETAKGHFDQTASALQAMGRVKTLKEAVELQTSYLRTATEHAAAGTKKLVEATNQLTQVAMSPVVEQLASVTPVPGFTA